VPVSVISLQMLASILYVNSAFFFSIGISNNANNVLAVEERLNSSTSSWFEEAHRNLCRDGMSVTRVKYNNRYTGALPFKARYSDLEPDVLLNAKPVEADECASDMLGALYPEDEPCCCILYHNMPNDFFPQNLQLFYANMQFRTLIRTFTVYSREILWLQV